MKVPCRQEVRMSGFFDLPSAEVNQNYMWGFRKRTRKIALDDDWDEATTSTNRKSPKIEPMEEDEKKSSASTHKKTAVRKC